MSVCAKCNDPLTLEVDLSDDEDQVQVGGASSSSAAATVNTVPDDVALSCGCHFHWQCLLDSYQITECPHCNQTLLSISPSGTQQILCTLHNEGGIQEGLDILPLLAEESYLRAYPEDRICRAFLDFCREGDVTAIVELLKSCDEEDLESDDDMDEGPPVAKKSADQILRYQDPIGEMQSGLHAAVAGGSREVAWLLLLLASNLPELEIPALVYQEAGALGIMRGDQEGKVDIRSLKDAEGKTAEQLAAEIGGVWIGWPGSGRLAV
ncbi:hypothetical protein AAFC00_001100 [Neodothiora populina]|uniref:RING-type domain-containing protein n=1 Tax=Neodothiora populina TaxID=2781224 RepID=A0ABR3PN37_9PEZI